MQVSVCLEVRTEDNLAHPRPPTTLCATPWWDNPGGLPAPAGRDGILARGVKGKKGRADHRGDIARRVKGRGGGGLCKLLGLVPSLVNHISWRRNSSEARKCWGTMRLRSVAEVELRSRDCCCWSVGPKHNAPHTYFTIKVVENNTENKDD